MTESSVSHYEFLCVGLGRASADPDAEIQTVLQVSEARMNGELKELVSKPGATTLH